jgi:hypothetical protein
MEEEGKGEDGYLADEDVVGGDLDPAENTGQCLAVGGELFSNVGSHFGDGMIVDEWFCL